MNPTSVQMTSKHERNNTLIRTEIERKESVDNFPKNMALIRFADKYRAEQKKTPRLSFRSRIP